MALMLEVSHWLLLATVRDWLEDRSEALSCWDRLAYFVRVSPRPISQVKSVVLLYTVLLSGRGFHSLILRIAAEFHPRRRHWLLIVAIMTKDALRACRCDAACSEAHTV